MTAFASQTSQESLTDPEFERKLECLADLAVRVGVNLQPGERLNLTVAGLEAAPFARLVVASAYRAGASFVELNWTDPHSARLRYELAPEGTLEIVPEARADGIIAAAERGEPTMTVSVPDPGLLSGLDPARISTATRAWARRTRRASEISMADRRAWLSMSVPGEAWARRVFPDLAPPEALARLWDAVFEATRADLPDPVGAWEAHARTLAAREEALNERRFDALRFRGPGTDLMVGLCRDHRWLGGASRTPAGVRFMANIPTEEVFTTPDRQRADGIVTATKPLNRDGNLIEGLRVRFEDGRVVEATATAGQAALDRLLDTDEGARRLGEVSLVPASSPIARTGLLFYSTLFDENAASHLALGRAYASAVSGGQNLGREELLERGANDSLIHADWMIGSEQVDVDGLHDDGREEPVMRAGEWAF